jgi:hypothetical protein
MATIKKQGNKDSVDPESLFLGARNYRTLVLSTDHLKAGDAYLLERLSRDADEDFYLFRDEGWLVKLTDGFAFRDTDAFSDEFKFVVSEALKDGFEMIDFYCEARVLDSLPTY